MKSILKEVHQPVEPKIHLNHPEPIQKFENKTDDEVWRAFDKGNELAFNYIYRIYVKVMFRYGSQVTKDGELIKDCIQNIFIGLRRKRGSLPEVKSIKGYLFKALQREIIRKLNLDKISNLKSEEIRERFFPISLSHESMIIQKENEVEKRMKVRNALNKLTSRQRQAILLLYEEGMSYKEIAETMEFNEVKSARKIIYRALATLKEILKG
ncbi:MAG: sigma-70 family RNA polymerase sigma factor [Cyclobacteriaceae bacterium]